MLNTIVREALVASVAWTLPPVRRHNRNVSIVPKASSPRLAAAFAPATLSRIHAILEPEKYASNNSPVRLPNSASPILAFILRHQSAVRRSCQTIALWIGRPVARSHTTVVSR